MTPNKSSSFLGSSTGNFTTASGSVTDVTNASGSITTTGKAVKVSLQPAGDASNSSYIGVGNSAGASARAEFTIYRDGVEIANPNTFIQATGATVVNKYDPPGYLDFTDYAVEGLPGTYTYALKVQLLLGNVVSVQYCKLSLREVGV